MPAYPGNDLATLLYENQQGIFWDAEAPPTGTASVAFQLRRTRGNFYPNGVSVEVAFAGDPGDYVFEVQTADTDNDSHYVATGQLGGAGSSINASFTTRLEMPLIYARFLRLLVVSRTNTAACTAMVTR